MEMQTSIIWQSVLVTSTEESDLFSSFYVTGYVTFPLSNKQASFGNQYL